MRQKESNIKLNEAIALVEQTEALCGALSTLKTDSKDASELKQTIKSLSEINFNMVKNVLTEALGLRKSADDIKQYLAEKDTVILDLKASLAESVVENRNLNKANDNLNSSVTSLNNKLIQAELRAKDASLKLSAASSNLKKQKEELNSAQTELQSATARVFQLKSICADHESTIVKQNNDFDKLKAANERLVKQNSKTAKDLEHLENSNKILKASLENSQKNEKELVAAIDALQREKTHYQTRFNNLLSGFKMNIEKSAEPPQELDSSVLEPQVLKPYLPFCFPERLPAPVKLRREVQLSFRSQLKNSTPPKPKIFALTTAGTARSTEPHKNRVGLYRLTLPNAKKYEITLPKTELSGPKSLAFNLAISKREVKFRFGALPKIKANCLIVQCNAKSRLASSRKIENASIKTNSIELTIKRLTAAIVFKAFASTTESEEFKLKIERPAVRCENVKISNYFSEKLAFRYGLQLQSIIMQLVDIKFCFAFKQGNKLKSVLEMFGNTINSMFEKYDFVSGSTKP